MIILPAILIMITLSGNEVQQNKQLQMKLSSLILHLGIRIDHASHLNIHAVSALTPSFFIFLHFRAHKSVQSIISSPLQLTAMHLTTVILPELPQLFQAVFPAFNFKKELLYCVVSHALKYFSPRQNENSQLTNSFLEY